MAHSLFYDDYEILAAGATKNYDLAIPVDVYRIRTTGLIALAGNMTFSYTGTPVYGTELNFLYSGQVTIGAFNVSFFGATLTAAQALYQLQITVFYNGSAWEVFISPDNQNGNTDINGADIVNASITGSKIALATIALEQLAVSPARGYAFRAGFGGVPETFDAVTAGRVLIGNGTDLISQAISGAFTLSGGGVATIANGYVTPAMLSFVPMTYYEATISLSSAQILLLNGTTITIVASPGAGFYIEVIAASSAMTFVSAAYTTNLTLRLINTGANIAQLQDATALIATVSKITKFIAPTGATAGQTQILANTALTLDVASGNPAAGDGTLKVHVIYRIVTV